MLGAWDDERCGKYTCGGVIQARKKSIVLIESNTAVYGAAVRIQQLRQNLGELIYVLLSSHQYVTHHFFII
jgi:hypothetical protein